MPGHEYRVDRHLLAAFRDDGSLYIPPDSPCALPAAVVEWIARSWLAREGGPTRVTAVHDGEGNFLGHRGDVDLSVREHRTCGGRARCLDCNEWCTESDPCPCCLPGTSRACPACWGSGVRPDAG